MFILPDIHGTFPKHTHIIYFSCDDIYYKQYGLPLIRSIVEQIPWISVHCHLLLRNPITYFTHSRVTYTHEEITDTFIESIPDVKKVKHGHKRDKLTVYYSCARFLQIHKLFNKDQQILQIDCDSLLFTPFTQNSFEELTSTVKCMRKPKSPEKVIASALSLGRGDSGQSFRKTLAENLFKQMKDYGAYWFIDQDVLQNIFNGAEYDHMPLLWNTWSFKKKGAYFRTGKGSRKDTSDTFNIELEKWKR